MVIQTKSNVICELETDSHDQHVVASVKLKFHESVDLSIMVKQCLILKQQRNDFAIYEPLCDLL